MIDYNSMGKGWRKRRAEAEAKRDGREAVFNDDVRRQRAALAEAARLEAEATAAATEAAIRQTVTRCPCCHGHGHLLVPDAATIIEAVERYKSTGWRPSPATVAQLLQNSFIVDRHGNRVDPVQATESVPEVKAADPVKAASAQRKRIPAPPFLGGD